MPQNTCSMLRLCLRLSFLLCLLSICLFGLAAWKKRELPPPQLMSEELDNEPVQSDTDREEFSFNYMGEEYKVVPMAEYELWGLLVSHNDISGFTDIYHTERSVDIKDICVIWGENVEDDRYRAISFSNDPWACHFSWGAGEAARGFDPAKLSNNHLLSDSEAVRRAIKDLAVGDQVYLQGLLVNYARSSSPNQWRKSSLKRTDSGNGACEVFFVEDVEVLKKANKGWHMLYRAGRFLAVLFAGLTLLFFVLLVYAEQRALSAKIEELASKSPLAGR